ncbi:DUF512 domain-containing protein [Selenihalanaerobacter shriftii]|uniref:Putative radical SAM enzyme, TIGR03279 family n=1 Tax=Selenihalanaerobacter shriftii TaxID=142842 RepID=A0A1T4LHT3_9FIRM|nr:DUF512 domain-containing protein [Selenihalanaerobacter shriftii]SJZ54275.1 putative radical SAM enzyme, TIGR03279 family [Selenihalanaerobacter shriftii]
MVESSCIEIETVQLDSIADELNIEPGDQLLTINGSQIRDYIDYKFLITDLYLEVLIRKSNGEEWLLEIEKDYDEGLGLEFSGIIYDDLKKCNNNCLFCFVNQSPPGLRETLNLKDDDYRFSFLQGSYITLTNLSREEINRIKRLHLSPIYISVHTTNPELRVKMLRNSKAGDVLSYLKELAEVGIEFHTQIVLCPEINDGDELERTIKDLLELSSAIRSLAVVPVGLTKFRDDLYSLRSFTTEEAKEVVEQVEQWQKRIGEKCGENFLYLSDEFYLLANESIPPTKNYNGYPQLENGVGMVRLFWEQFNEVEEKLPTTIDKKQQFTLITGELGVATLEPMVARLNEINNLDLDLLVVQNSFFGENVTVTGLLTGQDIIETIKKRDLNGSIILPELLLNEDRLFIDDLQLDVLEAEFPEIEFIIVNNNAKDLVKTLINI